MHKKGITLLIAVLVASIALAIGLGIFDIFFRELRISRGLLPSFVAFYAADAGVECALYYHIDIVNGSLFNPADPPATINCGGNPPTPPVPITHTTLGNGDEEFTYEYEIDNGSCVRVRVIRRDVGTPSECNRIEALGRNENCAGSGTGFVVERGFAARDPTDPSVCSL